MVGANLTPRLIDEGFQVSCLSRSPGIGPRLAALASRVTFITADVTDGAVVRSVFDELRPDVVFHLASTPLNGPVLTASQHLDVNVLGTLHVLEALRHRPETRLVFSGSVAEYGGGSQLREDARLAPATLLGATKAAASVLVETFARLYGIHSVELRLFMVYGPWEHPRRLVPHTILSALEGRDVEISKGTQERDFVYIDDLVDALMIAATRPVAPGSIFNIASGVGTRVCDVARRLLELMGDPVRLLVGAVPTRPDEITEMSADTSLAKSVLGWSPCVSLDEGLRRSVAWFSEHAELARTLS